MWTKDIDKRSYDKRADVGSEQIEKKAERGYLIDDPLQTKVENGKLAQEDPHRPDNEKEGRVGLFRKGNRFHPGKTGNHGENQADQKILFKVVHNCQRDFFHDHCPHALRIS